MGGATYGAKYYNMDEPTPQAQHKLLYDEKVAQTPANQYNDENPQKWLEWTQGYLIGRRWEMENMLKWAGSWGKATIDENKVEELRASFCHENGFDPVRANRDLWSFLNLNVTCTKAEPKFRSVKRLRGFEAWRAIVVPIEPKTLTKRRELHRKVHHPVQCKRLSEAEAAIVTWEKNRDDYYECGGQTIEEKEQCTIILDLLPEDTPSTLMMALDNYDGDFAKLKKKIDEQITFLTDHSKSHNGKIHLADNRSSSKAPSSADEDSETEEVQENSPGTDDLTGFAEPMQNEIFAMMRAKGYK